MASLRTAPAARRVRPGAPRWRREAPTQQRSRETLERFALATEELLREKPFEEISVQEIVARAGRPVGSFYARFASKEALLPLLYERYDATLEAGFAVRLEKVDWEALEFEAACEATVDVLLAMYDARRWLIRALTLFARSRPEAIPEDVVQRRGRVYDPLVHHLVRHRRRIRHADPEAAVRFGLFLVSSVAREKLLFGSAPLARITPMTRASLRDELVRALAGYLGSAA